MPVYVYRNLRTGEKFEVEQRITEPALTEHPESGDPVKRLIQPVGIAFKGSGFYVTDSRGGSTSAAKSSGAEGKSAGGSEAKAEKSSPEKSGSEKSSPNSTSATTTAAKSKE